MNQFKKILVVACISLVIMVGHANASLVNGGFEDPAGTTTYDWVLESSVPGWDTNASDHMIEFWGSGFNGVDAYEGNQFVELNANEVAALYQDITSINAGEQIGWEFAHRGRSGDDTIDLSIIDLGADNAVGGGDDTVLFTDRFTSGNADWMFYSGRLSTLTLGNTIRFLWDSHDSAGSQSFGNFLDAAAFGVGAGFDEVPEPVTLFLFGTGLLGLVSFRRKSHS